MKLPIVKLSKKGKMAAAILGIMFIAYNATLFALCGFAGHSAVFWMSWAFMLIAFGAMTASGVLLGQQGLFLRDWIFGFPIVKHSTGYIIAEFMLSCAFILFEGSVRRNWAFGAQFLLLCVYGVCAVSCFLAKEETDDVRGKASGKTRFIRSLCADAESLAEKCADAETREACSRLAEALRYSDPMSTDALSGIEQELAGTIASCGSALEEGDSAAARELCGRAMRLLSERNRKCRAMK